MNRILLLCISTVILLSISSCERKEYSEEGIKKIVEKINVKLEKAEGVELNWGSPEAYSIFTAYFSGEELMFINESFTYRKPAESFNLYYFKDGNLILAVIKKLEYTVSSKDIKAQKIIISLEFYSDPDENILFYEKIVNRQRTTFTDDEAEEIFRHANELKEIVKKREISK